MNKSLPLGNLEFKSVRHPKISQAKCRRNKPRCDCNLFYATLTPLLSLLVIEDKSYLFGSIVVIAPLPFLEDITRFRTIAYET